MPTTYEITAELDETADGAPMVEVVVVGGGRRRGATYRLYDGQCPSSGVDLAIDALVGRWLRDEGPAVVAACLAVQSSTPSWRLARLTPGTGPAKWTIAVE